MDRHYPLRPAELGKPLPAENLLEAIDELLRTPWRNPSVAAIRQRPRDA